MKFSKQLTGVAGEYYVAAKLSRRGYLAAITLRNSDGTDILVSDLYGTNHISIQVKTTRNKFKWLLSSKVENVKSINLYYIFVSIPSDIEKQPIYYIINSINLANRIYSGHKRWLTELGKYGQARNDSNARQFDPNHFESDELLNWEELILKINKDDK